MFARLATELTADALDHVLVVGSLAAASHHADNLVAGGVKTKDADLVIHPAGHTVAAQHIARRLLSQGWCKETPLAFDPGTVETPADRLPAIRL